MKLCELFAVMHPRMPVTVQYDGNTIHYDSVEELREDYMFYDVILWRRVVEIWHSKNLYNSMVIVLE